RVDLEPRPHEYLPRESGPEALAGSQAAPARRGPESRQPPDGRRRGSQLGRPTPVLADWRARQGWQNPQEAQAVECRDHSPSASGPALCGFVMVVALLRESYDCLLRHWRSLSVWETSR